VARLVIVSNRVPPVRERAQSAGGLAIALKDALARRETLWFGWSGRTTSADTAGPVQQWRSGDVAQAVIDIPAGRFNEYYGGFSNGTLWPLLHWRSGIVEFRRATLESYRAVNEMFAAALAPLLRPDDVIWVHDYHLIPLGAALRRHVVSPMIGFFLHTPFPPAALFETLPRADTLARDFGSYQLIGVQTTADARNLSEMLSHCRVRTPVEAIPVGIDADGFSVTAARSVGSAEVGRLRGSLNGHALIIGVDRLDYTKGLPERFRGYLQLLRRFPAHRGKVSYLQIAPISRGEITQYRSLKRELDELSGQINGANAELDWTPLRYITRAVDRTTLAGLHRVARVGLVTPLRDGMNLVAKEYVAAQNPEDPGVLVLSRFAGAAEQLEGALLVNPRDPDEIAEAIDAALSMPLSDRQARWQSMMAILRRGSAEQWARTFLSRLEREAVFAY
jgi:trehalose 6-phosphate synthase